ncbi:MAG: DUF839 domain-containing protein, partial [Anaerolineales bacterium]|nr:DUF839 domain-containing protein [Anaerolineales bacterium]
MSPPKVHQKWLWLALPLLLVTLLPGCIRLLNDAELLTAPYVYDLPDAPDHVVIPLATVGDEMPLLTGTPLSYTVSLTQTFALTGWPDGLGLFSTPDGHFVYVNHEIVATSSSLLTVNGTGRINGARVSLLQFSPDWQLISGRNLIERVRESNGTVYTLDPVSGDYRDANGQVFMQGDFANFSRFCSGYLAETGFLDLAGQPGPLWFAPQEAGAEARGWVVYPDGTATPLDGLGRFSKEQIYAAGQYRAGNGSGQTVLLATEDNADGELYLFIGQQTGVDPNGFADGQLYVLRVHDGAGTAYDYETMPLGVSLVGEWTPVPAGVALGSGAGLSDWVNEPGRSTNFRRLEDIHEDPTEPGSFYLASTGHTDVPPGGSEPDNDTGRLHHFSLNPADPAGPMTFTTVLAGGPTTGVSYDNLVVDDLGRVTIQEDRAARGADIMAAQQRYSRILRFDPSNGQLLFLWEVSQAIIDPAAAGDYGNWESSG